jgi:hypothetical protein
MSESTPPVLPEYNYETLTALAKSRGRLFGDIVAQTLDTDPFFADQPGSRINGARWFAELWTRLDIPDGIHVRRLHYLFCSTAVVLPNGVPYQNTLKDWQFLARASSDARYLNFVPAGAFIDRRAAEPIIYMPPNQTLQDPMKLVNNPLLGAEMEESVPMLNWSYSPSTMDCPDMPCVRIWGPGVSDPYAIELWAEKSTMNDVLLPLAERHRVGLVTGVGEMSITQCHTLVERARQHRKKTRILYISDHDPSGENMPVSVSRKIEFFMRRDGDDLDIRLHPLVLTPEQVQEYSLPRIPIKESHTARAGFENRHGDGGVELDALEALHPGVLRRIVEEAIVQYRRPVRLCEQQIREKEDELREEIKDAEDDVIAENQASIDELSRDWDAMEEEISAIQDEIVEEIESAQSRIEEMVEAINARREAWAEKAGPVWTAMVRGMQSAIDAMPEVEWPEMNLDEAEDPDPLFDSRRGYLEQLDRYFEHKGKEIDEVLPPSNCAQCGKPMPDRQRSDYRNSRKYTAYCSGTCKWRASPSQQKKKAPTDVEKA